MRRSRRVLACTLLLSAAIASAQTRPQGKSPDLDRLMSALAQRPHGHVTFLERKYLAILDRPVESSGELLYDAPDRLEKRTLKPKPESLVLQGGVVRAQRGRHTYTLDLQRYPQVVPFIESIRATLAGDEAALERVFKVRFEGSFDHWKLLLVPLDPKLAAKVREIHIQGEASAIHSVEIQEADGDRSVMTIGADVGR
ncbi:MAG TPA: LolA-related protein [Steroidobacteraceae bacterium]|nr:LolA-related protein [Steroidobacteraceae bacterium]